METLDFSKVNDLLSGRKKILVTSHANPDGDAIGSLLALYHFLTAMGHEVSAMVPDAFPDFLDWLPGRDNILFYNSQKDVCDALFASSQVVFSLDYNAPSRIHDAAEAFTASQALKILIDHHIDPHVESFDHCISTTDVSSTCELLYQFLKQLDHRLINHDIAACIFVGILTDTGSFSYNCNFPATFMIVAELIRTGIDTNRINQLIYANNTESRLRLLGYALSEKLVVVPRLHTAYISLSRQEMNSYNYKTGDTEGLVNYALGIRNIRFAVLFTERENKIRISFRSKGDFSVNDFARKHYSGGGHKNAAGGDSFKPMDITINEFNRLLETYSDVLS